MSLPKMKSYIVLSYLFSTLVFVSLVSTQESEQIQSVQKEPKVGREFITTTPAAAATTNTTVSPATKNATTIQPPISNNSTIVSTNVSTSTTPMPPTNSSSTTVSPPSSSNSSSTAVSPPSSNSSSTTVSPPPSSNSSSTTTTTTTHVVTPSIVVSTAEAPGEPITNHDRHFDGPSFIGGIVLTVGLTAIGFVAFKFYRSGRSDNPENYRKL